MQIDHINIRAPAALLDRVRLFYCSVLGLEEGFRPSFSGAGHWLYADDRPIIHLSVGEREPVQGEGYLDHVAFRGHGLADFERRLQELGIAYRTNFVPELDLTQLFLRDPAGIGLEVNFTGERS